MSGTLKFLFGIWFAHAGYYDPPPLYAIPFADLAWPAAITHSDVSMGLREVARQLYGRAFVEIGDESDFMHGHFLLTTTGGPLAILFHTQENPHLRPNHQYMYHGHNLDPYARNFLLFLSGIRRGDVIPAEAMQRPPATELPTTVSLDMLDPLVFGENLEKRQTTFFFFRTPCRSFPRNYASMQKQNLVRFELQKLPVCLALINEECRNAAAQDEDRPSCRRGRALPNWSN